MGAGPEQDRNDHRGKRGHRGRGGRGGFQDGEREAKRPRPPPGSCWFCTIIYFFFRKDGVIDKFLFITGLSNSEVEKHLVVSVGNHSYLALPKGGLTPNHVLILPISHFQSSLDSPEEVLKEMERFKEALRKCFRKQSKSIVFFERNYK